MKASSTALHHDRLTLHGTIASARRILTAARRPEKTSDTDRTRRPLHAQLPPSPQRRPSLRRRRRRQNSHAGNHARGVLPLSRMACACMRADFSCVHGVRPRVRTANGSAFSMRAPFTCSASELPALTFTRDIATTHSMFTPLSVVHVSTL